MKKKVLAGSIVLILGLLITGCLDKKEPVEVSTHPREWTTEGSMEFHGEAILDSSFTLESCQSCHGKDYQGGASQVSCFASGCHEIFPHPEGFADFSSPNFHENFIRDQIHWDILTCRKCHGDDYSGEGFAQKNCLTCHTAPEGPEACNTCHGNADNFAPPRDLHNNFSTTAIGVGAHQTHLVDTTWTTAYQQDCQLCHVMPSEFSSPGHVDGALPAEVTFGEVATDSGLVSPRWNHADASCSDVYCHGNFTFLRDSSNFSWAYEDSLIQGNNPQLLWTSVGAEQDSCGSCHGLPPTGHIAATTCNTCHGTVVDENFNIINKTLHINGKIDVF